MLVVPINGRDEDSAFVPVDPDTILVTALRPGDGITVTREQQDERVTAVPVRFFLFT